MDAVPRTADFDARSVILSTVAEQSLDLVAWGARGTGGIRGLGVVHVDFATLARTPKDSFACTAT